MSELLHTGKFTKRGLFTYASAAISALSVACGRENTTATLTLSRGSQVTPLRTEVPTAVVVTQPPTTYRFTRFNVSPFEPNKIGIDVCTNAVNGTLRVDINQAPDGSDKGPWQHIKELGVPCFNTNPANKDWPEWITDNFVNGGTYLIRAQYRPVNTTDWNNPAVLVDLRRHTLVKP